jgi:hypothetical protein
MIVEMQNEAALRCAAPSCSHPLSKKATEVTEPTEKELTSTFLATLGNALFVSVTSVFSVAGAISSLG